MLKEVLEELDQWATAENRKSRTEGFIPLKECEILVIGQAALMEADLSLHLTATIDIDVYKELDYSIRKQFEELLKARGRILDPVGHEAWMPDETQWNVLFKGQLIQGFVARPEYIMISKALKAPQKNKTLLTEYIASEPPEVFFSLAEKYEIDLESILK